MWISVIAIIVSESGIDALITLLPESESVKRYKELFASLLTPSPLNKIWGLATDDGQTAFETFNI